MNVFLELTSKRSESTRVRLKPKTVIGRSKQCQLRITSTEVSREHCQISVEEEGAYLIDLGSSNGTVVDGQPVKPGERIKLNSGARLTIGPAQFVVHINTQTQASHAVADDSFLVGNNGPMHDTALLNPGQNPVRIETIDKPSVCNDLAEKEPSPAWPGITVNDEGHDADSNFNFTSSSASTADHSNEATTNEREDVEDKKPSKLFSLFSLLKRSGSREKAAPPTPLPSEIMEDQADVELPGDENSPMDAASSSEVDENAEETLVVTPNMHHMEEFDVEADAERADEDQAVQDEEPAEDDDEPNSSDGNLNDFLKGFS